MFHLKMGTRVRDLTSLLKTISQVRIMPLQAVAKEAELQLSRTMLQLEAKEAITQAKIMLRQAVVREANSLAKTMLQVVVREAELLLRTTNKVRDREGMVAMQALRTNL